MLSLWLSWIFHKNDVTVAQCRRKGIKRWLFGHKRSFIYILKEKLFKCLTLNSWGLIWCLCFFMMVFDSQNSFHRNESQHLEENIYSVFICKSRLKRVIYSSVVSCLLQWLKPYYSKPFFKYIIAPPPSKSAFIGW